MKQTIEINLTGCRRQTSWLCTSATEELNWGLYAPRLKRDFNLGFPDFKSGAVTTRPRCEIGLIFNETMVRVDGKAKDKNLVSNKSMSVRFPL